MIVEKILKDALEHSVGSPGPLFAFFQLLLGFAELGQVESSNLLGVLDLLLVGLDLALQLAGKVGHPVLVLLVLVVLEQHLLDTALGLLEGLLVLGSLGLQVPQLDLQLADAALQLCHGGAASSDGVLVGILEFGLQVVQLGLKGALGLGEGVGVVLLCTELVSKTSSVNHCLLGLVFGALGLLQDLVHLGVHGVHGSFDCSLVAVGFGVDGSHLDDGGPGLGQLRLGLTLAPVRGLVEGTSLLQLGSQGVGTTISQGSLLGNLLAAPLLLLASSVDIPQLSLEPLGGLVDWM